MTPGPSVVRPADVADLRAAWSANPSDLGVGLYNPATGEIRLGSFDTATQGQGHQGLADTLGIADPTTWRGFIVSSDGGFVPTSHFNLADGGLTMKPSDEARVRQELQQAGLLR